MPPLGHGMYTRTFGAPSDNEIVMFFTEAVQDEAATAAAGRPIFRDEERIEIRFPGNLLTIVTERVTDHYRQKYARQYEAFKRGEEVAHEGTPIEQLTVLSRAQVKELKFLDVHTVEHAAGLDDHAIQRMGMGARRLREMAQKYLEQAQGFAPIAQLVEDKERLEARVLAQDNQLGELNRLILGLQTQLQALAQAPRPPEQVSLGEAGAPGAGGVAAAAGSSLDHIGEEAAPTVPLRRRKGA